MQRDLRRWILHFFLCLCATPPHPHTHSSTVSVYVCLSVCVFPLSLSPHCGREFATVIKFHVSFTTCYNISIWLALVLFVSYLFSACAAVAVLSMPQKPKREMWKKIMRKYPKHAKLLPAKFVSAQRTECCILFMQSKETETETKRNWRDSFSIHAGQPIRPPYKVAPKFGFRRTLRWFVWPLAELTEWCIKLIAQPPN